VFVCRALRSNGEDDSSSSSSSSGSSDDDDNGKVGGIDVLQLRHAVLVRSAWDALAMHVQVGRVCWGRVPRCGGAEAAHAGARTACA